MSQPKRFTAANMREAYQKVRDEMGGDAIIVSTRKVLAPGVVGEPAQELVEVRARIADASELTFEASAVVHDLVRETAEGAAAGMSLDPAVELAPAARSRAAGRGLRNSPFAALADTPAPAAPAVEPPGERSATLAAKPEPPAAPAPITAAAPVRMAAEMAGPSIGQGVVAGLSQRVDQVRALVESMAMERMGERSTQSPALRAAYERLDEQDMTRASAATVLGRVESLLSRNISREAGLRALNRALAALLPVVPTLTAGGDPRALVLVGPSGAGKTTLAMRMALEMRRRGQRVMVASTDISRVGAPQQLDAMGEALHVPVSLCYAPSDVSALLAEGASDIVIVDTAGHMGGRRDRLAELSAMLRSLPRRDVLLALPATMRAADQRDVVAAYQRFGLAGLVLTRCDETARFGASVSVSIESSLGVAYTTHSDQVTEAPRVGDTRALAAAVATGRWVAGGVSATTASRALARAS
ncbi:MAG: hypothetical protein C4558_02550 [Dehalococcoidia bacterium]|nr:MAG: hypothetical protein C4558_02550 [Dehalococcoidia bacterium]